MSFRCSGASGLRDESLAGTASTVRAFLLVEHPGSWGVEALRDARLPDGIAPDLRTAAAAAGVRVLLVRRPGRARVAAPGTTIFAAYADSGASWFEQSVLTDLHDVLDLDLAALRAGRSLGLTPREDPLLCVCTHGRHDACCAEQGRPVAAALAEAHPEETWEVSHIGGDRFAGNLLVLPHGLYYGRLDPASAIAVAGSALTGHLDLDHFRGRSSHAMPVQAAEIALRRRLQETRDAALTFLGATSVGDVVRAGFAVAGAKYEVTVRTSPGAAAQLTCRAVRESAPPVHEVVEIRPGSDAAAPHQP